MRTAAAHAEATAQCDLYSTLAYGNLAEVLIRRKNWSEARRAAEKALEQKRVLWPKDHPRMMSTLTQLGQIAGAEGQFEKALALQIEAVEIGKKSYPEDPYRYAPDMVALAETYGHLKKPALAVAYLEQAMRAFPDDPGTLDDRADATVALANVLWSENKTRPRAHDLVEDMQNKLRELPASTMRDTVEAWLKAHPLNRAM